MNKKSFIYLITNKINNHKYVGQTIDPHKRWLEHCRPSVCFCAIDKAINKYGKENFSFEIIEECDIEDADDREIYWISYYNTYKNKEDYNSHVGGKVQFGENNPMYGKKGYECPISKVTKEISQNIYNDKLNNKDVTIYDLSDKYNLSTATVSEILKGKHWSNFGAKDLIGDTYKINGKCNKFDLDYETSNKIYDEYKNNNITFTDLGKKYNIPIPTISKICKGKFYYTKDKQDITKNKHTSSKFTEEEKHEIYNMYKKIRPMYKTKHETYLELVKMYENLSYRTAQRICNNKEY